MQTQKSLIALASGVPAFMMIKVLASGFYARQDIKTPVKVGALAMLINSFLCAILIWPLAHAGLALASTLAGYVNCGLLLYILIKRKVFRPLAGWWKFTLQIIFANTSVAAYLFFMSGTVNQWLAKSPLIRVGFLFTHVFAALVIYLLCLFLSGIRPAQFRGSMKE